MTFQQQLRELLELLVEAAYVGKGNCTTAHARINALLEEAMPEESTGVVVSVAREKGYNAAIAETKPALGLASTDTPFGRARGTI